MKIVDNREPLLAAGGAAPYRITAPGVPPIDAHVSHLIKTILTHPLMTVDNMADSHHGFRVLEMVLDEDPPPELKFEDADHAWLLKKVDVLAPAILKLMAQRFRDALEPMSVADKKGARKGEKDDGEAPAEA